MSNKIYTKTGDKGQTSLIGGTRVPKHHIRIESYGTIDELNSYIGLIADQKLNDRTIATLREIQDRLFTIGALLANDDSKMKLPELIENDITFLEKEIDFMNETLEPQRSFILPGGHTTVSFTHIARCICRRAERLVVLLTETATLDPNIQIYINRLSDYLFTLARYLGLELKTQEIKWIARI